MLRCLDIGALKVLELHCIICHLDNGGMRLCGYDYPHFQEAKQLMIKNALGKMMFGLVQII